MTLKDTFSRITNKAGEADKQQGEFARKLEAYQRDKARGEAGKAAALAAKDERAYKDACRAIADAEAGIEFNSICLQEVQQKQFATDADDREISSGLNQGTREIYADAMGKIEKALTDIVNAAAEANKKLGEIDAMAQTWSRQVMKRPADTGSGMTYDKHFTIAQFYNSATGRLNSIKEMRNADPCLQKNGGR